MTKTKRHKGGGGGGGGGVLRKTNSIFIERKDGILLRCMQILKYFHALGNIHLRKLRFSK